MEEIYGKGEENEEQSDLDLGSSGMVEEMRKRAFYSAKVNQEQDFSTAVLDVV